MAMAAVTFLVHMQYERVSLMEKRMFGFSKANPGRQTAVAMLYGLLGGFAATVIFFTVGIPLGETGIWYVWIIALLLMWVHPRFMCFSYAGGIVGLASLVFGVPKVDVAALTALVAVLHMVEAFLIAVSGHRNAAPVYLKQRDGRVVGGFSLQKFWPLPFLALFGPVSGITVGGGYPVDTPSWWPLIRPDSLEPAGLAGSGAGAFTWLVFLAVAAVGYGEVAVTCLPKPKARRTALILAAYSAALLGFAVLADRIGWWRFVAVIFATAGHELTVLVAMRGEQRAGPVFKSSQGAMVLDVVRGSPADRMGLAPGDVISEANGIMIGRPADLAALLEPWLIDLELSVTNVFTGIRRTAIYKGKLPPLGVLFVPDENETHYLEFKGMRIASKLRGFWGGGTRRAGIR